IPDNACKVFLESIKDIGAGNLEGIGKYLFSQANGNLKLEDLAEKCLWKAAAENWTTEDKIRCAKTILEKKKGVEAADIYFRMESFYSKDKKDCQALDMYCKAYEKGFKEAQKEILGFSDVDIDFSKWSLGLKAELFETIAQKRRAPEFFKRAAQFYRL